MFCPGSSRSSTSMSRAVSGMSCMRPVAPFSETAPGLKFDSTAITALRSGGASPYSSADAGRGSEAPSAARMAIRRTIPNTNTYQGKSPGYNFIPGPFCRWYRYDMSRLPGREHVDFLVLGGGIAGLSFALEAAGHGSVLVLTKRQRYEGSTQYAQGGIASVLGPDDDFEHHIEDTLVAGAGLCHRDAVEVTVREGPERIRWLQSLGVELDREGDRLHLTRE